MSLKLMMKKLNEAKKEYDKQLKAIGKDVQKAIAEELAPNIPPGYVLTWTQYTPYFNDGEACTFSVHDAYLKRVDEDGNLDDDEGLYLSSADEKYGTEDQEKSYQQNDYDRPLPQKPGAAYWDKQYEQKTVTYIEPGFPKIEGYTKKQLLALQKQVEELHNNEDLCERAFGDHVRVVIGVDGKFSADEYSHD